MGSINILLIHPCPETLCLCPTASEMWRTPLLLTSVAHWGYLPNFSKRLYPSCWKWCLWKSVVKCGSSMMAPRHTALMSSVSIWMELWQQMNWTWRPNNLDPFTPLTWLHWISFSGGTYKLWCARLQRRHDDLVARIAVAAGNIWKMLGNFQRVQHTIARRCRTCNKVGGHHFEQLLWCKKTIHPLKLMHPLGNFCDP
jgi:hypothetical protein